MLLLVAKAHETILRYQHANLGRLIGPRHWSRIRETAKVMPWAADNDAFSGFDTTRYLDMLDAAQGITGCKFLTAPDVVGDYRATVRLFDAWYDQLARTGLPVAYVGQDGATRESTPWRDMDALFVGGSTMWKLSGQAHVLVDEAKERGKWVHMGRVNSWRRLEYAKSIGCDSVDGTQFSMYTDLYLPRFLEMASSPTQHQLASRSTPT